MNTDIINKLSSLPSNWRKQIADVLDEIRNNKKDQDCLQMKECETVTSLSEFKVTDTTISITYTDENNVSYERSFDISLLLNHLLDSVDAYCIANPTEWTNMNWQEKMQALISYINGRCV